MSKKKEQAGPRLKIQARLFLDDEIAFGPGKADLLEAIAATGSISAAGKQLGMSYRRAWLLVDAMNRCFQQPLVETAKGGVQGGGALLSAYGEDVLKKYRQLETETRVIAVQHIAQFQPLLRKKPLPPTH